MRYILENLPTIHLPEDAKHPFITELIANYTFGKQWNVLYDAEPNSVYLGNYTKRDLENAENVVSITSDGIYIAGKDYRATMHGLITFLDKLVCDNEDSFYVECDCVRQTPLIPFRAVHLCLFPETELDFFRKCVRGCAVAKYTHIVFEFWGTLKFDCMEELGWPFAYSKEQIKEIVAEANALGVEIIPMFNHLGHASASRGKHGKHVVLDQNPKYEYMFDSYGWVWKFQREDVYELMRKIREELIDVCGKGSWFHLGCDEAFAVVQSESATRDMSEFLNKVSDELKEKGRRGIIWHDLLLDKKDFNGYNAFATESTSKILLDNLTRDLLLADWQYETHKEIWKTSEKLKGCGFDVVCCPWIDTPNIRESLETIKEHQLFGFLNTTWHTLHYGYRLMIYAGAIAYGADPKDEDLLQFYSAHVARKVMPAKGNYEKSGYTTKSVGPGL